MTFYKIHKKNTSIFFFFGGGGGKNALISSSAILAGDFLFLPANSDFHPHLAGKAALWHTLLIKNIPPLSLLF